MERRYLPLEHRAEDGLKLQGVAMRYGDTTAFPWGMERFAPGAFGNLAKADVTLNVQHDRSQIVARTGGGGLELLDSESELRIMADLPETTMARDAVRMVGAGLLRGLSVEFKAIREAVLDGGRQPIREIQRAKLLGIGIVDSAQYSQTQVQARWKRLAANRIERRLWL